jgi:pimeloyl-ACP methyl ester carboxylesterase
MTDNNSFTGFNPIFEDSPPDKNFPATMSPLLFFNGKSKLFGTMFIASGEKNKPTVLMLNGFPGNETNHDIARMLQRFGFNVMGFNYSGSWGSGGSYSFANILSDTEAALDFLMNDQCREKFRVDPNKIILLGYSMGGFSALYNSIKYDSIKNIIAIAPFNAGMFGQILESNKEIKSYSVSQMIDAMNFVNNESAEDLLNEMIENKSDWNLLNHLKSLELKNILLFGAKYDSIAPLQIHHYPLSENLLKANPNTKVHLIETGHSFSDKRIELITIIYNWVNKVQF